MQEGITYPTLWSYKVIILKGEIDKIKGVVSDEAKITFCNTSKNGKYESYDVEIFVKNSEEKDKNFKKLSEIAKIVL